MNLRFDLDIKIGDAILIVINRIRYNHGEGTAPVKLYESILPVTYKPLKTGFLTTRVQFSAIICFCASPPEYLGWIFINGAFDSEVENPVSPGKRTMIMIREKNAQVMPAMTFSFFISIIFRKVV